MGPYSRQYAASEDSNIDSDFVNANTSLLALAGSVILSGDVDLLCCRAITMAPAGRPHWIA